MNDYLLAGLVISFIIIWKLVALWPKSNLAVWKFMSTARQKTDSLVHGDIKKRRSGDSYLMRGRLDASLQIAYREGIYRVWGMSGRDWACGVYISTETSLTIFMQVLDYQSPHLYLDYKANNRPWRKNMPELLKNASLVSYEGFVSDRFDFSAPKGYHLDALVIGAPDVLDVIMREHEGADIEILGNQLYLIFPERFDMPDKLESVQKRAQAIAKALNDNLSRYKDERRISHGQPVGYKGRRLSNR